MFHGPARLATPLLLLSTLLACSDGAGEAAPAPPPGAVATAEASGAGSPPPARAAAGVTARGLTGQYDLGDYFSYGEVVNELDVPVYNVELRLDYLDEAGEVVATDEAAAVLTRVEPRSTAPVVNTYYGAPSGIQRQVATVTAWSRESPLPWHAVTIQEARARPGVTGAVVEGRGRNDSGRPLSSVKLVASFRDAAGQVVGVFFDYPVTGALLPGATFDFTLETMDDSVEGATVLVQGEGHAGPR